jgi:hypothetical protein
MAVKKPKKKAVKKKPSVKKKKTLKKAAPKKKAVKKSAVKRAKKPAIKKKKAAAKKAPAVEGLVLGPITHYFPKVRAAVVTLKNPLSVGDTIRVKGHTTDFTETVNSMQIDHVPITTAKKGQEIGLLVNSRVRQHDIVYKV